MKKSQWNPLAILVGLVIAHSTFAQNPLSGALTMGLGDVAAIKQRAEAGDAKAQISLGDVLNSRFHAAEALQWYRKGGLISHDPSQAEPLGRQMPQA